MNLVPKVSIIIPVYKVEKDIERCALSLFEQTLEEIEYIFVDDCSPDNSVSILEEIIKKYPNRQPNVKIVHHEHNRGLTSARNSGMSIASGEFITHCDSDDWVEPTMYEDMYECAKRTAADAVYCDIRMVFDNCSGIYKAAPFSYDKIEFLQNYIASVWTSLCNTLVKADIYKKYNLKSPVHLSYCEDFWLSVRLFHYSKKVSYIDKPFYNYNRINEASITHSLNKSTEQEERKVYLETIDFFNEEGVYEHYKKQMSWRVLKSTHDLALFPDRYKYFLTVYPESHKFIWSCPYINLKCKCIMFLLSKRILRPFGVFLISIRNIIR